MNIGILLAVSVCLLSQFSNIMISQYGKKYGKGGMFFNAIICASSMLSFFITDTDGLCFIREIWRYGILNAIMFVIGYYSAYKAYQTGSFGLTALFSSFSVVLTTFYGIFFLNEPTSTLTYPAIVMIIISLVLMNCRHQTNNSPKASLKWVLYVLLIVVSNTAITIIGRTQYGKFGDAYNNEFLIISLAGATIFLFIMGIIYERDSFKATIKHGILYGAVSGFSSGINNLLSIVIYNYLPISFTSPFNTGLGIAISFFVSALLYREKFTTKQLISALFGIIAVILININI